MPLSPDELAAQEAARSGASRAIIDSPARRRLMVAGPGTGKTSTFRGALEKSGSRGLALTFVRNLAHDLSKALGAVADVFTFHGYCKHLMHAHPVEGLSDGWHYYPPFLEVVVADLAMLGEAGTSVAELEDRFQTLDTTDGLIDRSLELGSYYDASAHSDVVFRVLRHFTLHPDSIPGYPLVVVDEYQDFSPMEISFIRALSEASPILAAGDDDQALYEFRHASPESIRDLARAGDYEVFPLPFCSRCPEVLVRAACDVLATAIARGLLVGRLEKPFACYMPEKAEVSERNPVIFHARCSVENRKAPYAGRYVERQIAAIPTADIERSKKEGYPTVLILGPPYVVRLAYDVIVQRWPHAEFRQAQRQPLQLLDGYRLLLGDRRRRLGWRLVTMFAPPPSDAWIRAIGEGREFVAELPDDYMAYHLSLVDALGNFVGKSVEDHALVDLLELCHLDRESLLVAMQVDFQEEPPRESQEVPNEPTIVCTSLEGAKGLSAEHVFVVGMSAGQFPKDPAHPTDHEVCCFLVALTRGRTACHLVSHKIFGGTKWIKPSPFIGWIESHIEDIEVNKEYLASQ